MDDFAREWFCKADGKKKVKTILSHGSVCQTVKQNLHFSVRDRLILEANPFSNQGLYPVVSENSSNNLPNLSARTPPSIQLYASSYQFNYTNNSPPASTYSAPSQKESMPKSFSIPQYIVTINQKVSETSNQLPQKRSFDEFTKKKSQNRASYIETN